MPYVIIGVAILLVVVPLAVFVTRRLARRRDDHREIDRLIKKNKARFRKDGHGLMDHPDMNILARIGRENWKSAGKAQRNMKKKLAPLAPKITARGPLPIDDVGARVVGIRSGRRRS